MAFTVIIPARFASTRLPGKPLAEIAGKPMIAHVIARAHQSQATRVIVATDHQQVMQAAQQAGAEVCLTDTSHQSGTERLAEVVEQYGLGEEEIIVNVQGDEPLIPPEIINQVAQNLAECSAAMATLAVPITDAETFFNPNVVKVVRDAEQYALYFSRAPIPWYRQAFHQQGSLDQAVELAIQSMGALRHIGIYAYRAGFIRRYVHWPVSPLEQIELLEQLRVLWQGEKIHVAEAAVVPAAGVDSPDDLARVRQILQP